jgi:hypothetical protein
MLDAARREWRSFRDDEPGKRFSNHHKRERRSASRAGILVRAAVGALLIAGGIVLLFIPGPGLLAMLFGVALIAGESKWLATRMDRLELRARHTGSGLRRRWRRWRRRHAHSS